MTGSPDPEGAILALQTWPKNAWWKCPKCVRHFASATVIKHYEGRCNICNTKIDREKDRVNNDRKT